ncbi:hypothetical protein, variant [Aphanomyces astaci]|uniref:Phosphatidic acid phosphatase type 2/haloperoxidase domain-containing protein n=1 Tax=Aphanomyces astaci TaxID=112090 RepID=W4FYE2_APHAT|nr:hypothetical protein, variant [Aphanomyces astaci]ETV71678.1 hypothetical protein, variant [Aphanomyces astaci]|eukprot:XP_009838866.1 hypothetical protein, variant [Aphanomyces astaci]
MAMPISQNKVIYNPPSRTQRHIVCACLVTTAQVIVLSYSIPLLGHAIVQYHRPMLFATRDFVLGLSVSTAMAQLATNILKITTGRFRPNFYAMCHWDSSNTTPWDGTSNLCMLAVGELEGRQSFPSGHTSCAFSTLAFFSHAVSSTWSVEPTGTLVSVGDRAVIVWPRSAGRRCRCCWRCGWA